MKSYDNIKAIILDKDGVFVDFHQLWMRIIAARAQILAEYTTAKWEDFNYVRTMCIRAMGVDEEDESIDADSPVCMPADMVRMAVTTGLYLAVNHLEPTYTWANAIQDVRKSDKDLAEQLNMEDMIIAVEGSIEKIKAISKAGYKLALYTSDSEKNSQKTIEKFSINGIFETSICGKYKTIDLYKSICKQLKVKESETIFITDSPVDARVGREAGAHVIAVMSGVLREADKEANAEYVDDFIPSLAKLDLKKIKQVTTV